MNLYRIGPLTRRATWPRPLDFAYVAREGTYETVGTCGTCGNWHVRDVPPLIVSWVADSDLIGDFVWGSRHAIVRESVLKAIAERFKGAEAGTVMMRQDPRLRRPKRMTSRNKRRVWLPYEGPSLVELVAPRLVNADESRSTLKDHWICPECGRIFGQVVGIEYKWADKIHDSGEFDRNGVLLRRPLDPVDDQAVPREPGAGYLVSSEEMGGFDIVRLHQGGGVILTTELVKRFIEEQGYTNIDFREVGETFESPGRRIASPSGASRRGKEGGDTTQSDPNGADFDDGGDPEEVKPRPSQLLAQGAKSNALYRMMWLRQRVRWPRALELARARRHGPSEFVGRCGNCGRWQSRDAAPLTIEWLPGSDLIGDFSWPRGRDSEVVVKESVLNAISERFQGAESWPVMMWQNPRLHQPRRVTDRTKPRVWLPYEGPPLVQLVAPRLVGYDGSRSTFNDRRVCAECGLAFGGPTGIAYRWGDEWDRELYEIMLNQPREFLPTPIDWRFALRLPREPRAGYLVSSKEMGGFDIVRLHQAGGLILITEPVKRFIEEQGYTNIEFREVGETFD